MCRLAALAAGVLLAATGVRAQAPVGLPPAKVMPRVDALPVPATQTPVDLESLARGFAGATGSPTLPGADEPRLIVFISLSMPEATLARLVDQAARARAQLLLRGLSEESLPRTAARIRQLIGTRPVAVQIDPRAFDRYAIQRVPAFVLARAGGTDTACSGEQCSRSDDHVVAAGDVSLDYALDHFQRSAPAFAKDAGRFLARLSRRE
ncbi:MAG: type-F conjugative transfer system pilin assembly protein TrbC [Methylibium petroleiphilum]|jgi:conjugal transfer pilus assembly protein TrbC|nr:type-F conjugative transfer system pilin assembly protein TrbC [Methylibium petroleiphilum]